MMRSPSGEVPFLPFSRPSITEQDVAAVAEVLRSGWITTGPKASQFEEAFRKYVGCRAAVCLCSATAGMHLILKALGVGPGDEVITPSMTWVSTVNLVVLSGARPVFADVDPHHLMMTPEAVVPCVSERTRVVIPVHFAGASADLQGIGRELRSERIAVVEDAAHAVGTHWEGEPVGRRGTAVFSFHPIKNMTTGEGGMLCCEDPDLAARIRRLRFHGLGEDAYDRKVQGRSPQAEVLEPGYKYNLTDMAAALGLEQLKRLEELIARRERLARLYLERLASVDEILPLSIPPHTTRHAWHLFVVRLDTEKAGLSRAAFMEALKQKGIGTGLHFRPVHLQRYYVEAFGMRPGMLPHTEWNGERILSLPLYPDMRPEDVDRVVKAIKEVLARRPKEAG